MKFISDTIDETDLLEQTLKTRVESINGTLEKVELSGNHITPCVQVNFHRPFSNCNIEVFAMITGLFGMNLHYLKTLFSST